MSERLSVQVLIVRGEVLVTSDAIVAVLKRKSIMKFPRAHLPLGVQVVTIPLAVGEVTIPPAVGGVTILLAATLVVAVLMVMEQVGIGNRTECHARASIQVETAPRAGGKGD